MQYTPLSDSFSSESVSLSYLSACDDTQIRSEFSKFSPDSTNAEAESYILPNVIFESQVSDLPTVDTFLGGKKKYKPVHLKVRPIKTELPERYRIVRNITGDPLAKMPTLDPNPPPFRPTKRYTQERRDTLRKSHEDFLWPAELDLADDFMCKHEKAFAWTDTERGRFKPEFFPPIEIPTVPHTPWVQKNIPIPPGIYEEVCKQIRKKIEAGVYEPSNSSYRSRWFCVLKKDGKSLRIVHSLEPLNKVTIQHSGVTPIPEHLAEQFAGRACGAMFDLYVGYDERTIAEASRDLTTFQSPYGALRLVTLPMGWTNAVPIFHDDVTYILQPEIPHVTVPYIDDCPVKGPPTEYRLPDGSFETIPENPGIRRFVWEHFQNLNRVVQRMKYAGGTFSGHKLVLCAREITVLGHRCTPEGRLPDETRVAAIRNWGPCKDLSEVRAFLGTIGVVRIFIKNFAHRAHPLIFLTRKGVPFTFEEPQIRSQNDLKDALLESPALRAIDYTSDAAVILAVDTSYIAVGFHLCQCDLENPRIRYYNRFGSITLNDREARFSQPKLELYGLYRALRSLKLYLIGVRNLVVEVDARYIKGMLQNPDIAPSASINRWIIAILTFHFELVHVPGTSHGPDGLSRRPRQPGDEDAPDDEEEFDDWVDQLHGFMHHLNPHPTLISPSTDAYHSIFALGEEDEEPEEHPAPSVEDPTKAVITYADVPRTDRAKAEDARILDVELWHRTFARPPGLTDSEFDRFVRYCTQFFTHKDRLWRKHIAGEHKLVIPPADRLRILRAAHDDMAHRGIFATRAFIISRFWWPHLEEDVRWYVRSCHLCQQRTTRQVLLPPTVAIPLPPMAKVHIDTMHLPPSMRRTRLVQARCTVTAWPEFAGLIRETAAALAEWIYTDLVCRWGLLVEIVTDNGTPYVAALEYMAKKYHINHIRISGYNSRANGLVERPHFDVRQALYKAADGDPKRWYQVAHAVFWSERVTVRKRMGCSPYFAVTGTHPVLPLDIAEATYLLPAPDTPLSTTDLIARRAQQLLKRAEDLERLHSRVFEARLRAARRFEKVHQRTLRDFDFAPKSLVLMRNTRIEKTLNRKMRPRYLGPLVVIARNRGGAYILAELDGTVLDRPIAAFRIIPYLARKSIDVPDDFIDIAQERLDELKNSKEPGEGAEDVDLEDITARDDEESEDSDTPPDDDASE